MIKCNFKNVGVLIFKWTFLAFCISCFNNAVCLSQGAEENANKVAVNISLNYYNNQNGTRNVVATVSRKENNLNIYLEGIIINLYLNEISKQGMLGSLITGEDGRVDFMLDNTKFDFAKDTLNEFEFIARLANDPYYMDQDVSVSITEASIDIICFEEDSVKYVQAKLSERDSIGNFIPVTDVEVHFYVQRMFGLLPIGGYYTYTDDNGETTVEFPNDLPGDKEGFVNIIVKIEDDENYGNLIVETSNNWGIPLIINDLNNEKTLWSSRSNTPVALIIISLSIVLGVWSVIFYLIFQLYKIKKLSQINYK